MENMKNARDRLINSASILFADKGFHAVGTREISAHAKVNISAVSFYFRGKEGLLKAVLEELLTSGLGKIEDILSEPQSSEDVRKKLKVFLDLLSIFYIKHSNILRVYFQELEGGNSDAVDINNNTVGGVWDKLKTFLNQGIEKKFIPAGNSQVISLCMMAPLSSLLQNKNCLDKLFDISLKDDQFRVALVDQIINNVSRET